MRAHAAVAGALLALGIWLSSGTLTPYAVAARLARVTAITHAGALFFFMRKVWD